MPQDRFSDATQANAPSSNRFYVWSQSTTQFDHQELAENWDRLDAMFGRPSGGGQWPPDEGQNGGVYKQIKLLQQDREAIGSIKMWWYPFAPGDSQATIEAKVAQYNPGWVLCNGGRVGPAETNPLRQSHDFVGAPATIYVPDLRDHFVVGANSAVQAGTVGNANPQPPNSSLDTNTNAPGVVTSSVSGNSYALGSHYQRIVYSQANHQHYMDHIHTVPSFGAGTFDPDRPGYTQYRQWQLTDSASAGPYPHFHGFNMVFRDDMGQASENAHRHFISIPQHGTWGAADYRSGGAMPNTDPAGGFTIDQSYDNRPKSVGLLYIIKIKHQTVLT